jgi:hypothetical protein
MDPSVGDEGGPSAEGAALSVEQAELLQELLEAASVAGKLIIYIFNQLFVAHY